MRPYCKVLPEHILPLVCRSNWWPVWWTESLFTGD